MQRWPAVPRKRSKTRFLSRPDSESCRGVFFGAWPDGEHRAQMGLPLEFQRGPAVIVSNDAANRNLSLVVVPVTSNTGRQYPSEAVVTVGGHRSKVMADQIMAADKSRLKERL